MWQKDNKQKTDSEDTHSEEERKNKPKRNFLKLLLFSLMAKFLFWFIFVCAFFCVCVISLLIIVLSLTVETYDTQQKNTHTILFRMSHKFWFHDVRFADLFWNVFMCLMINIHLFLGTAHIYLHFEILLFTLWELKVIKIWTKLCFDLVK